jgi:predicted homoserine dehydrogenase-like protein
LRENTLPIGLAHGVRLLRDVPKGAALRQSDVALDGTLEAVRLRRAMEQEARPLLVAQ